MEFFSLTFINLGYRISSMGSRVYVGRLSYDCREKDLQKFFHGYGKIREILIKNGFAFVVSIFNKYALT